MFRFALTLPPVVIALACATATPRVVPPEPSDRSEAVLRASAAELMTACWPEHGESPARVTLTLTREEGRLVDVAFATSGGAGNAVARCAQQIAWSFPWEGSFPETMDLTPPLVRPSGWTYLAHLALQNRGVGEERGIADPGPLVRACLAPGGLRTGLRFRVQPLPVKVTAFVEKMSVGEPSAVRTDSEVVLTETERCVAAVLSATAFTTSRALELDFSYLEGAPASASPSDVAHYFPPGSGERASGRLDADRVQTALEGPHPEIAACWSRAIARRSGLRGARTLRIRVLPDGKVGSVHIAYNQSDTADEAVDYVLDRCLVSAVSRVTFPAPDGGTADVAYSWVFAHR